MTRPLRVLYFDHTAELGGGEIALVDIIRHLDRSLIEPIVLLGSEGPLVERLKPHVAVHVLRMDAGVVHARKDTLGLKSLKNYSAVAATLRYLLRLRRFVREQRVDVLHTNSLKSSVLGGIAGRLLPVKVVWHIRDRIAEDYLPAGMVRMMRTLAGVLPHFVIGNSLATIATLQLKKKPSAAVPSGVDLTRFTPAHASQAGDAKIIGLVGRICPWKGQHIFLKAASLVHARWPQVRFRIIGAALFREHAYELELHRMVGEAGLQEVVEFSGFQQDVAAAMASLDILVHASTVGEPFGQVIVQGMACAKPVIATNGGGVPEIVIDGETGLLIPMDDAPAMAEAICSLLADEARAEQMGEQGRRRVIEHFTIQQSVAKLMHIYEGLVPRPALTASGTPQHSPSPGN